MRNPDRLDGFYEKVKELHKKYCPDWRFGQLMSNFADCVGDIFYWEEDAFLESFEEYLKKYFPLKKKITNEAQKEMIELMKNINKVCDNMGGECDICPFDEFCSGRRNADPTYLMEEVEKWEP